MVAASDSAHFGALKRVAGSGGIIIRFLALCLPIVSVTNSGISGDRI